MECTKTGKYPSLFQARKNIRHMKGKGYKKLYPYFCKACRCYHVSSTKSAPIPKPNKRRTMLEKNKAHLDAIRGLLPELSPKQYEGILDVLQECHSDWEAATEICDLMKMPRRELRGPISKALQDSGY